MPFFWNDKTYWERVKFGNKMLWTIHIPFMTLIAMIIAIFMYGVLSWKIIAILAFGIYSFIYTFVDIFLQLPHVRIPDSYSKEARTFLYIVNFLFACLFMYFVVVGVLQHYYPFLAEYACCDVVKNVPKI